MCSKKTEKLMPQALENWPHYKYGTEASTGEKSGGERQVRLRKTTET